LKFSSSAKKIGRLKPSDFYFVQQILSDNKNQLTKKSPYFLVHPTST